MRKSAWLAAVAATGVMLTSACADLLGFHDLRPADGGGADVDQPDADGGDGAVCTHAAVPTVPSSSDPGDAGDFTLAVHHVFFTSTLDGGAGHYGYDIDDHCTVDKASSSCVVPTGNTVVVDEPPNGIDNETIALLNALITAQSSLSDGLGDTALNKAIANGDFTVLLRLYGYKGVANQGPPNSMFFGVQASPGPTATPAFDGGDRWFAATQDVSPNSDGGTGTNFPLQTTTNVYVTNHVLVVTFPTVVTLRFLVAPNSTISGVLVVKLQRPVMTATITPRGDGRYDLTNGTIVGRWDIVDGLQTVGSLALPGNTALCDFAGAFDQIRGAICGGRDVNGAGNDDGAHPCDAVSVAVGFDAVAADVTNSPQMFPESTTPCADAGGCPN